MKIYKKIEETIGNTPLLELTNIEKKFNLKAKIYAKLEYFNPAGSVKDRVALSMINDAEERGLIKDGATIIEPTSGNTGIGLALIGASRGYKVILTMPDTMSKERIKLIKGYGAEVVLTEGKLGMEGAVKKAIEINENTPNSFIPSQFDNPANVLAHYKTTAREIWEDTEGEIDVFVASVGSGGTITGIAKFLKEQNFNLKVFAVEPEKSPLISKGISGAHGIQGIGANFIPKNFDKTLTDGVLTVQDEEAIKTASLLAKTEGLLVGISSGANVASAIALAKKDEFKDKIIVTVLPDTGERYLSTSLFNE